VWCAKFHPAPVEGELLFRQPSPTENAVRRECLKISDIQEEETEV
jgi:hypothetical protein